MLHLAIRLLTFASLVISGCAKPSKPSELDELHPPSRSAATTLPTKQEKPPADDPIVTRIRELGGEVSFVSNTDRSVERVSFHSKQLAGTDFLQVIKKCGKLKKLTIYSSDIVDDDLKHIGDLTTLEELALIDTPITDDGFAHLKNLIALREVGIYENKRITDKGMRHLRVFPKLVELSVIGTAITDTGLIEIGQIETLEVLRLQSCFDITDAGFGHLKNLRKLKMLWVGGTLTTEKGTDELQKSIPGLQVMR